MENLTYLYLGNQVILLIISIKNISLGYGTSHFDGKIRKFLFDWRFKIKYDNYFLYVKNVANVIGCAHKITAHLIQWWSSNTDTKATTTDGRNYFACWITTQNQSTCWSVFFHCAAQSMLCVFCQAINFSKNYNCKQKLIVHQSFKKVREFALLRPAMFFKLGVYWCTKWPLAVDDSWLLDVFDFLMKITAIWGWW